jgi:hypothetical protein
VDPSSLALDDASVVVLWEPPIEMNLDNEPGERLVCAMWTSGDIVWSHDRLLGGPPFLHSRLGAQLIDKCVDDVVAMISDSRLADPDGFVGLLMNTREILVTRSSERFQRCSGHELMTSDEIASILSRSTPVATKQAAGRSDENPASNKYATLAGEYSRQWDRIVRRIYEVVPTEGDPVDPRAIPTWAESKDRGNVSDR